MELRPEVKEFALMMEQKLQANDSARGDSWKSMTGEQLGSRLGDELDEFIDEWEKPQPNVTVLAQEAADIANFLMFVVENEKTAWAKRAADIMTEQKKV